MTFKPSLLLHVTHPTEKLLKLEKLMADFQVSLLFYQPSSLNEEQYIKDQAGINKAADLLKLNVESIVENDLNEHQHDWNDDMDNCLECERRGIEKTSSSAEDQGYDFYASLILDYDDKVSKNEEELAGSGTSQFLSLRKYL